MKVFQDFSGFYQKFRIMERDLEISRETKSVEEKINKRKTLLLKPLSAEEMHE